MDHITFSCIKKGYSTQGGTNSPQYRDAISLCPALRGLGFTEMLLGSFQAYRMLTDDELKKFPETVERMYGLVGEKR